MGKMSRNKGKEGERGFARFLCAAGFHATRGVQYHGGKDSPDVLCASLPGLHFEVKRVERLQLYDALRQAQGDSGENQIPVVAHRRNNHNWVVILDAEDFLDIVRESNLIEGETDE